MKKKQEFLLYSLKSVFFLFFLLQIALANSQQVISLAGRWKCELDPDSTFFNKNIPPNNFDYISNLPGSLDQDGIGKVTLKAAEGRLTRLHTYYGPAWYEKEIIIPSNWKRKIISLFLERVMWSSTVYVDGKKISEKTSLYTPHVHTLGTLSPGKHRLIICVNSDQVYKIGTHGHGYSDQMQTIWNGIIGQIKLVANDPLFITHIFTYPNIQSSSVRIKTLLQNDTKKQLSVTLSYIITDNKSGKKVAILKKNLHLSGFRDTAEQVIQPKQKIKLWDEFNPNIYTLKVSVFSKKGDIHSQYQTDFGFRVITTTQHKILVNGKPVFFRLDINNISFPLTGYPPMDEASWVKLFKIYKSYGFNGVRCHSWCPPEAAFDAADKLGMYIEAELVWPWAWKTEKTGTKAEWIAKGYTDGLGSNPSADLFVPEEMHRVINSYGNHPSFAFFCIGNELGGSDFNVMKQWVKDIKSIDYRHLYAVSTARTITNEDDFNITHYIPDLGGTYGIDYNNTWSDHDKNYKQAKIPIIAHEIGQYPVYPRWRNLDKYTGILRPWYMIIYKKIAEKNGIYNKDSAYRKASGALQQLLYKNEFEDLYRTKYCAGYCVLDMEDYTGQGAALVGWLDAFYDSKGITTPRKVRMYNNDIVLLLRTRSFVFSSEDTLHALLQIANYSNLDLTGNLYWEIKDQNGKIIHKEQIGNINAIQGHLTNIGSADFLWANAGSQAGKYTFSLVFGKDKYRNDWNFFVFPGKISVKSGNVLIAHEWTNALDRKLAEGGMVLLLAHNLGTKETSHPINFSPVFWSLGFFPQQKVLTLGALIENKSPLFNNFPTSYFTDWQWFTISKGRYFYLKSFPKGYRPIIEPIPDFHNNNRLGSIFEAKVSNGKLLVCGYDLSDSSNVVSRQLLYSILEYMRSSSFNPSYTLQIDTLKKIFIH